MQWISLRIRAKKMGTIVPMIILDMARIRVLRSTTQLSGRLKIRRKFSSPTHSEPKIPFEGMKCWKAMTMPIMGRMAKISSSTMPGSISRL